MTTSASVNAYKQAAAERAVAALADGMVVGLGSGSTAEFALAALERRIARGLRIVGVPTSEHIADLARRIGVPLAQLGMRSIDVTIDGADEIERGTLNLIKGGGGNLVREKLVACASRRLVIIADDRKLVDRLGTQVKLPVALLPFARALVLRRLEALGIIGTIRRSNDHDFITDDGLLIADCTCGVIDDPVALAARLDAVPGVVDCGLFLRLASEAIVAGAAGIETITPASA